MIMKKIERRLKSEANGMLPDANVKERIRRECFDTRVFAEVEEPAFATATVKGSSSNTAHMSRGKKFTFAVAFILLACLIVGTACYLALAKVPVPVSETFVNISINPEFGITANESDIVTEVTALNEDAAVVLYGMNLVGLTVTEATNRLVAESAALGYLDTSENGSMEILAVNENGLKEDAVTDSLLNSLGELFATNNWQTGIHNAACNNPDCTGDCTGENCQGSGNGSGNGGNGNGGNGNGNGYQGGNGNGGNGNGYAYQYKYSFGRNSATAGKTALAQRACNRLGNSYGECIRMSVASIGEMMANACRETVGKVESALQESFENNSSLNDGYNSLQQKQQEREDFVRDIERVLELLDESDGYLSPDEWSAIKDLLHHPYLDLGAIVDLIESWWGDFEELCEQIEDLLEDALEFFEEEVHEFGSNLAKEVNEWKKEFIEEFMDID